MSIENNINVGIIGTGVGIRTHLPGFRKTGRANIVGIVGTNQKRAEEFATKFQIPKAFGDFRKLCQLPEIDLICVTTPNPFHYEQITYALQQGKHVIAEKPLAMNIKEVQNLNVMSKKTSKLTMVDHQLRFNPYIQKVRELIQNNSIGRPYFIRIHQQSTGFSNKEAPWSWSFDEKMGGGVRLAMASHFVDLLLYWLGPRKIFNVKGSMDAVIPKRKDSRGKIRDIKVAGFFSAGLAIEGGLDVQMSSTAAAVGEPKFDFSIYGTDGELHFDLAGKLKGAFLNQKGVSSIGVDGVTPEEQENKVSIFSGSFVYFAPRIVDAILANNRNPIKDAATFADAVINQKVLDAIQDSALSGRKIKLDYGYVPGARV